MEYFNQWLRLPAVSEFRGPQRFEARHAKEPPEGGPVRHLYPVVTVARKASHALGAGHQTRANEQRVHALRTGTTRCRYPGGAGATDTTAVEEPLSVVGHVREPQPIRVPIRRGIGKRAWLPSLKSGERGRSQSIELRLGQESTSRIEEVAALLSIRSQDRRAPWPGTIPPSEWEEGPRSETFGGRIYRYVAHDGLVVYHSGTMVG